MLGNDQQSLIQRFRMSIQSRQKGRRSLSIFTIGHTRTSNKRLKISDNSHDSDTLLHSFSTLSCDPYTQSSTVLPPLTKVSHVSVKGLINFPVIHDPKIMAFAQLRGKLSKDESEEGIRPRSRFPFPHVTLSRRSGRHSPTVTRSIISGPILTATTNATVADAEGLRCQDIKDLGLVPPPSQSPVQPTDRTSKDDHASHNPKGLSRFSNFFNNVKKNKTSKGTSLPSVNESTHASENNIPSPTFEQDIARRRAEAVNLTSKKVNKFTGHGNIKRKVIGRNDEGAPNKGKQLESYNDTTTQQVKSHNVAENPRFLSLNHSRSDVTFGSLSRSIASVVDRLDQRVVKPSSSMNFIKSKSSIFNLQKSKRAEQGNEPNTTNLKSSADTSVMKSQPINEDGSDHGAAILTMTEALEQLLPPGQDNRPRTLGAPPESLQFSGADNAYIPAQPITDYPGGVKVLGTHSNPMEFATAPSWVTDLPKPPTHTPTMAEVLPMGEDDEHVIQDAPIYSPSLGDLSQYARPTPSSQEPQSAKPHTLEPETPSHAQAEKSLRRRLGLRKSKSGLGLLSMFSKQSNDIKELSRPLQQQDTNQKLDSKPTLRKSRSMNPRALLRKEDFSSIREPLLQDDRERSNPSFKPSPLRYQSDVGETHVARASGIDVVQKRTPPRGSITPSDRAKRMGIVGMPGADLDH